MHKGTLSGAGALLLAPLVVIAGTAMRPTISDDAAKQVAALADHRGATIAGMALGTIAVILLLGGTVWLALAVAPHAPRLGLAGGILGVAGSLVVLFEDGVAAAGPAIVHAMDPVAATAALDRIQTSTAVSGIEPLALLGDIGLALLGFATVRAGAPRWSAVAIALGAFCEGGGFGSGTKALVIVGFAVLFVGLVQAVRTLLGEPLRVRGHEVAPSY